MATKYLFIMSRPKYAAAVLLMAGAVFSGAVMADTVNSEEPVTAPVKEKDMLSKLHMTGHVHTFNFLPKASPKVPDGVKVPRAESILCEEFRGFAGESTKVCVTKSKKKGLWEKLIVDLNNNADLTDDKAVDLPAWGSTNVVFEREGKAYAFELQVLNVNAAVMIKLFPSNSWHGSTTLAGNEITWMAYDCNLNGTLDAGDTAVLLPGANASTADGEELNSFRLGPDALFVDGRSWYAIEASASNSIQVGPYTGEMSTYTIDYSAIVETADTLQTLTFCFSDGNQAIMKDVNSSAGGVPVPARVLPYVRGILKVAPNPIQYFVRNVDLRTNGVLKLERPVSNVSFSQEKGKLSVSQQFTAPQNVFYVIPRSKPGPLVEIFQAMQLKTPISTGNMEYG
jgi:hypothetical protein